MSLPDRPAGMPRPDLPGAGHTEARVAKKIVVFLSVLVFGAILGLLLAFFPPLLLFGAIAGLASVLIILARPFWGLILYALVFILRPAEMYPVLHVLHLERLVGALTLVAMFAEMYRTEGKFFVDGSRQTILFAALLLVAYLTVPFSYWPGKSMDLVVKMLKVFAFYLMVVQLVNTRKRFQIFVYLFLGLIVYLGVTTLHGYYTGAIKFAQGIVRAVGTTSAGGDPNTLGGTLGNTVALFVMIAAAAPRLRTKLVLWLGVLSLIWPMALTGSRASLLGFMASLFFLWTFSRRKVLMAALAVAGLAIAFTVLPEQYKTRYGSITSSEIDASSQSRLTAWKRGAHMFLDRPLLGVGIGCFGVAHAKGYSDEGEQNWLESHSLYLQVPAETGVMGTIVFFWFIIHLLRKNRWLKAEFRQRRPGWQFEMAVLDGIWVACLFLLVFSVFGHTMYRYTWYIYAGLGVVLHRLHDDLALPEPDASAEQSAPETRVSA